ncbi:hypothetical protein ACS0PU_008531 [Formica fusca]
MRRYPHPGANDAVTVRRSGIKRQHSYISLPDRYLIHLELYARDIPKPMLTNTQVRRNRGLTSTQPPPSILGIRLACASSQPFRPYRQRAECSPLSSRILEQTVYHPTAPTRRTGGWRVRHPVKLSRLRPVILTPRAE